MKQISSKDLELLSAHIDGELTDRQRIRLEARLQEEPILGETLLYLQQSKKILLAIPQLKSPRNFTLTSKMVGESQFPVKQYFRFRMVTAIASILLIFVLVGDYLSFSRQLSSTGDFPQVVSINEEKDYDLPPIEAKEVEAPVEMAAEAGELVPPEDHLKTVPGGEGEESGVTGNEPLPAEESESIVSEYIPADGEEIAEELAEERQMPDSSGSDFAAEFTDTPLLLEAPALEIPATTIPEFDKEEIKPTMVGEMVPLRPEPETVVEDDYDQVDSSARELQEKDVWELLKSTNRWVLRVIEGLLVLIVIASGVITLYFRRVRRDVS